MQGAINMSGNTITNLAALPVMPNGAAPAQWVLNQIAAQSLYQGTWVPDTNTPDLTQPGTHQNGFTWIVTTSTVGGVVVGPAIPGLQGQTVFNGDTVIYSAIAGQFQIIHGGGLSLEEAQALFLPLTGGQLSGPLLLNANASQPMQAVTLQQLDSYVPPGSVGEAPNDGQLYGRNGLTTSWAPVLPLAGGILTGALTLSGNAVSALQAVPFQQLNSAISGAVASYLPLAGGTMSGLLTLSGNAANALNPVPLQQVSGMLAGYLPISGGTLTGPLTAQNITVGTGYSVTLPGNAASALQAVPLQQLQAGYLPLSGGTLTGALTINGGAGLVNLTTQGTVNVNGAAVVLGVTNPVQLWQSGAAQLNVSTPAGAAISAMVLTGLISFSGEGVNYVAMQGANAHAIGYVWTGTAMAVMIDGANIGAMQISMSDATLKQNLSAITTDCLSVLNKLTLRQFDWLPTAVAPSRAHVSVGYTAQEVQNLIPEAVPQGASTLSVDLTLLVAYCIGAIQQLAARLQAVDGKAA